MSAPGDLWLVIENRLIVSNRIDSNLYYGTHELPFILRIVWNVLQFHSSRFVVVDKHQYSFHNNISVLVFVSFWHRVKYSHIHRWISQFQLSTSDQWVDDDQATIIPWRYNNPVNCTLYGSCPLDYTHDRNATRRANINKLLFALLLV